MADMINRQELFGYYPKNITLQDGRTVAIRPVSPADADALVALFENVRDADLRVLRDDVTDEAVVRSWAGNVAHDRVVPLVAEVNGRIIAIARLHRQTVTPYEGIGEIRIYVAEGYRQRGLGDALIEELLSLARRLGLEKAIMEFYVDHSELIAAYERRGWEREAILPTFQLVVLSYDLSVVEEPQHPDIAHAEKLPPPRLWPERIYDEEVLPAYPDRLNLSEQLLDAVLEEGYGDKPAIFFGDRTLSYAQIHEDVCRLASGLTALGLSTADPALIFVPNIPEAIIANLAIQRAGALSTPAPPQLSRRELAFIIRDAEAQIAITTAELLPELLAARSVTDLGPIVVIGETTAEAEALYQYEAVLSAGTAVFDPIRRSRTEVALLVYTYRDDGEPKGAAHLNEVPLIAADLLGEHVWQIEPDDIIAAMTPVGLAQGYITFGVLPYRFRASAVLVSDPEPQTIIDVVARHDVTVLTMTPTYYRQILAEPALRDADVTSLRLCASAGEALTAETFHAWQRRYGLPIYEGFGTTEILSIFLSSSPTVEPRPGSVGKPVPGYDVRVVNEQGRDLPPDEIGHLVVRGPTGTLYWKDDQAQAEAVWHGRNRVGDYAYYDADGYVWYVARQDDSIKSGGYRIDPAEVEAGLREHPCVADAAVIGLPDAIRGQTLHAFIVPKPGIRADEALAEDMLEGLHGRVASYKVPSSIAFIEALPRNGSGQLLRRRLRERMRQRHGTEQFDSPES